MIKELVMEVTNSLPDTATFDDIIEGLKLKKGWMQLKKKKDYPQKNY